MNPQNEIIINQLKEDLVKKFGIEDPNEVAVLLIDLKDALADALDYTNRDVLVGNMDTAVKDLYIFRRNTEGVEGETSRSEGGVSQSFEIGIPKRIRTKLNRYRIATLKTF